MSEEGDECAKKARAKRKRRKGDIPSPPVVAVENPEDPPMRDEEGRFVPGHPGLRPSTFKPEYVEKARKLAQLGATNAEIADLLDVGERTFYEWRHSFPEFAEALKLGKAPADDRVETSFYQAGVGYDYEEEQAIKVKDAAGNERVEIVKVTRHKPGEWMAAFRFLINRRPEEWRDKREVQHGGEVRHIPSREQAERELADFYRSKMVDGGTLTPLPDLGTEADRAADF